MSTERCVDGKLDASNYSSPMPVIGLYIVAATLVCLLLMILDIFVAFRNRKRWIPCRFFSLNSVTLTLLAVAAKLPVDLTTSMPNAHDQLSKLTGTTLICVSMSFLMPSIGANRESECFSNVIALTIFTITVVVNISIQLHTGVIFLFRVENIIILCCMMTLTLFFWNCARDITFEKEVYVDHIKNHFTKGQKSMLHRLKLCYLYGYNTNPQFMLSKDSYCAAVNMICMFCSVVVLQAGYRSLVSKKLKSCSNGVSSDYSWSMWIIVVSQIITILGGSLGVMFRWFTMMGHSSGLDIFDLYKQMTEITSLDRFIDFLKNFSLFLVDVLSLWMTFPLRMAMGLGSNLCKKRTTTNIVSDTTIQDYDEVKAEFEKLAGSNYKPFFLDLRTFKKAVKEREKWIKLNEGKACYHLIQLLSETPPSQDSLTNMLKNKISSLSVLLVAKIATMITIPSSHSQPDLIFKSLKEVFEIIHFVDGKMSSPTFENKMKLEHAKELWEDESVRTLPAVLPEVNVGKSKKTSHKSELEKAIEIIGELKIIGGFKRALPDPSCVRDELAVIKDFLQGQDFESDENLLGYVIVQLFVDMLHEFLIQVPYAICKDIAESYPEDCEEKVKFALKLLCIIGNLGLQWSFPIGVNISGLISDVEVPSIDSKSDIAFKGITDATHAPHPDVDSGHIVPRPPQAHEIIQVEV